MKTRIPGSFRCRGSRCGWAATYFPTLPRSIIGAAGLNFSVRDGKRCAHALLPPLVSLVAIALLPVPCALQRTSRMREGRGTASLGVAPNSRRVSRENLN